MKRILTIMLMASVLYLSLTGLRVALLERLTAPWGPHDPPRVAPRSTEEADPQSDERPEEYIAGNAGLRSAAAAQPGLLWLQALGEPRRRERISD